jgi:4'-phosphopantetheinyl transferase
MWHPVVEDWRSPPSHLTCDLGEVHVWRWRLDRPAPAVTLAADEQLRADRFRFDCDRQSFVAARSGMRRILGRYLDQDAGAIEFAYGSHGKPLLANGAIEFNLSHSGDWALLAVARDRPVGVDIERIKPMAELEKLTARFLMAAEHERIVSLPEVDRVLAFFRTWTCKEAYLKATGEGLGQLKSLEVAVQPEVPVQLLSPSGWNLLELVPEVGYVGALVCGRPKVIAAPGADLRVSFFAVEDEFRRSIKVDRL